jgi:predicted HicB family RNase H-like nuclease
MSNILKYKNFVGSIEFSEKDQLFYGTVQGMQSLISYEGANIHDLTDDFHYAIDDFLATSKQIV